MSREAVRKFGVELEGYFNSNLEGHHFYVGNPATLWNIKEDGSLSDDDYDDEDEDDCGACGGTGHIQHTCSNPDCEDGEVCLTDADGNDYEVTCKSCGGDGYYEEQCGTCNGSGTVYSYRSKYGLEVVSPPITDVDLITEVYHQMNDNGWSVDNSAGLHIHVDARDLTPKDFYKVLLLMTAIEPIMYGISDTYRFNVSGYCQPLVSSYMRSDVRECLSQRYDNITTMRQVLFTNDRYSALNFLAFNKHNTIEFRYFSPQTDAAEVINRVELVTRIVDFAKYASYEQVYVAYKKVMDCEVFEDMSDVVQELLQLPFDLKSLKKNDLQVGRISMDMSHNQARPISVEEAV